MFLIYFLMYLATRVYMRSRVSCRADFFSCGFGAIEISSVPIVVVPDCWGGADRLDPHLSGGSWEVLTLSGSNHFHMLIPITMLVLTTYTVTAGVYIHVWWVKKTVNKKWESQFRPHGKRERAWRRHLFLSSGGKVFEASKGLPMLLPERLFEHCPWHRLSITFKLFVASNEPENLYFIHVTICRTLWDTYLYTCTNVKQKTGWAKGHWWRLQRAHTPSALKSCTFAKTMRGAEDEESHWKGTAERVEKTRWKDKHEREVWVKDEQIRKRSSADERKSFSSLHQGRLIYNYCVFKRPWNVTTVSLANCEKIELTKA